MENLNQHVVVLERYLCFIRWGERSGSRREHGAVNIHITHVHIISCHILISFIKSKLVQNVFTS